MHHMIDKYVRGKRLLANTALIYAHTRQDILELVGLCEGVNGQPGPVIVLH